MNQTFSDAGSAVVRLVEETWIETATKAGIDLTGSRPDAPLAERIAWAL